MEKLRLPISFTTVLLFTYTILAALNVSYTFIITLFISVNVVFIWLVIKILMDGIPSNKCFEDQFYEDLEIKRNN